MGKAMVYSAIAWFAGGKIHSSRALKKLKTKFQKEQKALYSQYYNDVYKLTEQNNELTYYVEQLQTALKDTEQKAELEALQRDYEEFKQPDIDGDDRISRAEFNMYVKNYLSNYPGLQEKDYPKFEDFDHGKLMRIILQDPARFPLVLTHLCRRRRICKLPGVCATNGAASTASRAGTAPSPEGRGWKSRGAESRGSPGTIWSGKEGWRSRHLWRVLILFFLDVQSRLVGCESSVLFLRLRS